MALTTAANRHSVHFLGFHDPSGATGPLFGADDVADDDQGRSIFGVCGVVREVRMHVVESFSANAEVVTLKWRPTPGSTTNEITLGEYTIPASTAAGAFLVARLDKNPNGETTIDAGGDTDEYGISGSSRFEGGEDTVFGPGGEFELEDAGSSTAGQVNVWLVVEELGIESGAQTITVLTAEGGTGPA